MNMKLTQTQVKKLGLDKVSAITADMFDGYTSVGDSAFSGCIGLTSITIPNSVTNIGNSAFYRCESLTSVTIGNSVASIGDFAFQNCRNLTSIIVENGNSFYDSRDNCNAIIETATNTLIAGCKNTTIPNSVTSIGNNAFLGCGNLASATIPNSVTRIGGNAFFGCGGLTSVTIPNSVTSIGHGAFLGCRGLVSIEIPNSITSIGDGAFSGCIGLTSITIPNSVTSIGYSAFSGCIGLTSITIPNSVTSIGWYAFERCSSLTSVTIPNSVTSIGYCAFAGCSGLTSIIIENGNIVYDSRNDCNAIIETTTNKLIVGCQNTIIPNSVTSIGGNAFAGCSGLTSVTIPNSVTRIGDGAFWDCIGLTSVTIPNSVTSIVFNAFKSCTGLTSLTIGDKTYEKQAVTNGKCKAYKAFKTNMTCRDFQYEEGETYEYEGEPKLCACGFHACLSLLDVFNYYDGELGKDMVVYEVELEGVSDERHESDSKVVAKKITIGKRIL